MMFKLISSLVDSQAICLPFLGSELKTERL